MGMGLVMWEMKIDFFLGNVREDLFIQVCQPSSILKMCAFMMRDGSHVSDNIAIRNLLHIVYLPSYVGIRIYLHM